MKNNKFRLFVNTDVYKSIFTFLSLTSILVLSIIILFSIDTVPLSKDLVAKTLYKVSLLFIVWYGGSIINKNLHISKHCDWISYLIATFLNSFLIALVAIRVNYNPNDFQSYSEHYYYLLGMFAMKIVWLFNLYFFEKNMRPYFAKYLFWQSIASILGIVVLFVIEWNVDRYVFKSIKYDHLQTLNLLIIWFMPIVISVLVFSVIKSYSQITKYASEERNIARSIIVWNAFVRIASLVVWVSATMTINVSNLNLYDYIFIGILSLCFLLSLAVMIISLIKQYNRFLVYTFTINLVIMSVCGFVFVNILKSTPSFTFLLYMIYIVLFQFMFTVVKPKVYRFFPQLNSLLTYKLMIFILLTWTGNQILGEINFLNINELMWGAILILSLLMSVIYISVELFISMKISWSFAKIIKNENIQKNRNQRLING